MIRRHRIERIGLAIGLVASFAFAGAQRLAAEEPTYNELQRQFESAYAAKDYKKALEVCEKLHEARPRAVAHIYNIACMNCLIGEKDKAYDWLEKLADAGYKDAEYLREDADFRTMHAEARFRKIADRISGKKPAKDDDERKIKKLKEDKPKIADAKLSPRDHAAKINELTQKLMSTAAKDKKKALEFAMEAHEHARALETMAKEDDNADPRLAQFADARLGLTAYNVACMYSLLDKKDEAFDYLNKAIDHKSFDENIVDQIKGDSDLDALRSDARYARAMERLGEKVAKPDPRFSDDNLPDVDDMPPEKRGEAIGQIAQELVNAGDKLDADEKLAKARVALAHAKKLMDLDDKNPRILSVWSLTNYNVACMHSLKKDADAAFFYLGRAVDAGGFGRPIKDSIENDSDFDNIRKDDRYDDLINRAKAPAAPRQRRSDPEPEPKEETVDPAWKVTLPKKHDASKASPLIVALHHYHGNMDSTTDRWRKAADEVGAILLTPQGTVSMGDGMFHWGRDIDTIERDVMKAIDKVLDEHKVDSKKIVLAGFSQGGWATWAIAARNPDTFRGIIPVCGRVGPEIEKDLEDPDAANLRVWIMLGEDENSSVVESNERAAKVLKKAGARVKSESYDGVGHGYPENHDEELVKALRFILD